MWIVTASVQRRRTGRSYSLTYCLAGPGHLLLHGPLHRRLHRAHDHSLHVAPRGAVARGPIALRVRVFCVGQQQ